MALLSVAVVVTATLADAVPLSQTVRRLVDLIEINDLHLELRAGETGQEVDAITLSYANTGGKL